MLTPADIRRLLPEQYEFLWRTILRREHGVHYKHIDGNGIDCLTEDDATAYQVYHHKVASGEVVRDKLRDDLKAAQAALAAGRHQFDRWIFVSTYSFKEPEQRAWLDQQRANAVPLAVTTWGDEDLCGMLARHSDLAAFAGLAPAHAVVSEPSPGPDPLAPKNYVEQDGILWGMDPFNLRKPFCVGCFTGSRTWVPMSTTYLPAGYRRYVCPHGHPMIVLSNTQGPPYTHDEMMAFARQQAAAQDALRAIEAAVAKKETAIATSKAKPIRPVSR